MEVSGIISGIVTVPQTQLASPEVPEDTVVPAAETPEEPVSVEIEEASEKLPGVIRNLLNGHFKGVSDLRLRIVHAEKLKALEEANLQEALENETGFLGDFDEKLSELLAFAEETPDAAPLDESIETPDALPLDESVDTPEDVPVPAAADGTGGVLTLDQEFYASEASDQIVGLLEVEDVSKDQVLGMISDLQSTIGNLLTALEPPAAVTAEIPEAVEGTEGTVEPLAVDPPSELDILIASFIDMLIPDFLTELNEFAASLGESVLPELSEPSGNGKAYDKFLPMYNDLWGVGETTDEPSGLDVIA